MFLALESIIGIGFADGGYICLQPTRMEDRRRGRGNWASRELAKSANWYFIRQFLWDEEMAAASLPC